MAHPFRTSLRATSRRICTTFGRIPRTSVSQSFERTTLDMRRVVLRTEALFQHLPLSYDAFAVTLRSSWLYLPASCIPEQVDIPPWTLSRRVCELKQKSALDRYFAEREPKDLRPWHPSCQHILSGKTLLLQSAIRCKPLSKDALLRIHAFCIIEASRLQSLQEPRDM